MRFARSILVRIGRSAPVRTMRHVLGRAGAPGLNPSFELVHRQQLELGIRLERQLRDQADRLREMELTILRMDDATKFLSGRIAAIDDEFPALLNAMNSANGTARLLRRELDERLDVVVTELARIVAVNSFPITPEEAADRAELHP